MNAATFHLFEMFARGKQFFQQYRSLVELTKI